MSTNVIGSRYRLGSVVTCSPDATTWDARDTWLDERVLVVTPEPGCDERFASLATALLDRSSDHLVGLYDIGSRAGDFVVFGAPEAVLADEHAPREEEDVLVAGRALGDALEALHERGLVLGDLHPGSVAVAASGDAALSPWPLAPRPYNWSGPGGFGSDPDEPHEASSRDDVRALGAVLLGALAGPPFLSSEQVGNLERELSGRAPNAVAIADRALTPPAGGGYAFAGELRDDCAAALDGRPVTAPGAAEAPGPLPAAAAAAAEGNAQRSEGRRAAMVLAASGAALCTGFGFAGALGAGPHQPVRPVSQASDCVIGPTEPRCEGPAVSGAGDGAAQPASVAPVRLAADPVPVSTAPTTRPLPALRPVTPVPPTSATAAGAPASSTTTAPPSTTTSSPPSTSTTTTDPPTTTSTTSTAPTTTSSYPGTVQAGPYGSAGGGTTPSGGTANTAGR